MIRRLSIVFLFLALTASADTLTPLRSTLTTLRGVQPVAGVLEVQRTRKTSGRFANNQSAGNAAFGVNIDANGLHLTIGPNLLEQAAREAKDKQADDKKMTPTRSAIEEMEPLSIVETLNFADELSRILGIAQIISETRAAWQGKPARLLSLKLTEKLPAQAKSVFNVQFTDDHMNLWVSDDNIPLAAERIRKGSARFLFLRGEMNSRESWQFTKRDDRLVITRFEASFAGSGFGQRVEGKTVQTVTLR